jgi:hypothetical protein
MARGYAWAATLAVVATSLAIGGCAIHTQGPIKEVAYDFSDRDFYDRAYAPSPKYLETDPPLVVQRQPDPRRPSRARGAHVPGLRPSVRPAAPATTAPSE